MYKEIDDAVGIWMSQFLAANQTLRGDILQKKAKQFADRFGYTEFTASAGWLTNFKKRNNVQSYIKSGEAASGPSLEEIDEYRRNIAEKLSEYALEDIYNCDETGILNLSLFFIICNLYTYTLFYFISIILAIRTIKNSCTGTCNWN
jgi:hypothetical protein